jgi:hypothetical protein
MLNAFRSNKRLAIVDIVRRIEFSHDREIPNLRQGSRKKDLRVHDQIAAEFSIKALIMFQGKTMLFFIAVQCGLTTLPKRRALQIPRFILLFISHIVQIGKEFRNRLNLGDVD